MNFSSGFTINLKMNQNELKFLFFQQSNYLLQIKLKVSRFKPHRFQDIFFSSTNNF